MPVAGKGKPEPFLATQFDEVQPMFSPDGRWIAFSSDRSGQVEVYVKPSLGEGRIVQISTDGGHKSVWARSGQELFYRNGDKMIVVSIRTKPALKVGTPRLLFEDGSFDSEYDVSLDGQRFVMIREDEQASASTDFVVVLNWFEELKRLVPTE
ncbi:hypothetical protein MYX65_07805 [Acidobacteria bacterium AH-259-L09]|nr:hypothetical protein [Acidobacteria bacterium AH-259-L09]